MPNCSLPSTGSKHAPQTSSAATRLALRSGNTSGNTSLSITRCVLARVLPVGSFRFFGAINTTPES
eukprot:CAMPEP_0183502848 /NCGR_PEP_ID=MMETSP0371-20130417/4591_1 /TAXON_ID=268820 /ORGANISM="Peridinium aciculiferum, Strain PAER-2" /LENGTH=65 /DNA_ID=CAMNT_0025697719 /DNA_START=362 /DNA_END=556 /DNA_ORIENTATION=+